MKPEPVWKRILKALELGPMTCRELARCLLLNVQTVYKATQKLRMYGFIVMLRLSKGTRTNRHTRPEQIYGIVL